MKGIITVVGKDQIGIIAKICSFLSDEGINILDISQSIVSGYFNMIMIVDMENSTQKFSEAAVNLENLGSKIGVMIKLQNEEIFSGMHRL